MGGDSCAKGRGFESQHRILDGHFSHLFVAKIVMFFVKTKINEKDAGVGPFKKTFQKHFKNTILYIFTAFKNVNGKRDVRFS